MTKEEWKRLKELSKLHVHDFHGVAKMSEAEKLEYNTLFDKTREVDEHPEGWDWGCLCQLCCSYGD